MLFCHTVSRKKNPACFTVEGGHTRLHDTGLKHSIEGVQSLSISIVTKLPQQPLVEPWRDFGDTLVKPRWNLGETLVGSQQKYVESFTWYSQIFISEASSLKMRMQSRSLFKLVIYLVPYPTDPTAKGQRNCSHDAIVLSCHLESLFLDTPLFNQSLSQFYNPHLR